MNITKNKIDDFKRCVTRELNFRKRLYPVWIQKNKMSKEEADFEIETMQEIKDYFDWLQIHAKPEQTKLF